GSWPWCATSMCSWLTVGSKCGSCACSTGAVALLVGAAYTCVFATVSSGIGDATVSMDTLGAVANACGVGGTASSVAAWLSTGSSPSMSPNALSPAMSCGTTILFFSAASTAAASAASSSL